MPPTDHPWPKHPDGTNMTIGEMSPEDREAQLAAARRRFKAKHATDLHPVFRQIFKKHGME